MASMHSGRMGRLFECSFNEIYLFDASSLRFLEASRGALENLGYSLEELRLITPVDIKPLDLQAFETIIAPLRDGECNQVVFETSHRRRDGTHYPVMVRLQLIADEAPPVFLAIIEDISERQERSQRLQAQLHTLRRQAKLLDMAPVMVRSLSSRIEFWSQGLQSLYGYPAEMATGQTSHDLLRTRFPASLEDIRQILYEQGEWQGELVHTRQDGNEIVVASHWQLYRNADGVPEAILEINHDLSAQKEAEAAVKRINAELERQVVERTRELQVLNQEMELFSCSVSHDLRVPLRAINGYSEMLWEDCKAQLSRDAQHFLHRIRHATARMEHLIDALLRLGRITRTTIEYQSIDLSSLAWQSVRQLQAADPDRMVAIGIQPGVQARADVHLLQIVFDNLLGNAWKYTRKFQEACIQFGRQEVDGESIYFVRDNGAGFDMQFVGKLFGAFQRLHSVSEFEGTGLGLATVARILQRHSGRIWAEGKPGQGAAFYFTLGDESGTKDGWVSAGHVLE